MGRWSRMPVVIRNVKISLAHLFVGLNSVNLTLRTRETKGRDRKREVAVRFEKLIFQPNLPRISSNTAAA